MSPADLAPERTLCSHPPQKGLLPNERPLQCGLSAMSRCPAPSLQEEGGLCGTRQEHSVQGWGC